MRYLWMSLLLLAGCTGGAVVFAPTPLPPDVSPVVYEHPSGGFSLLLPRNWAVYAQSVSALASASFSPPDSPDPLLQVTVMNLGDPIPPDETGSLVERYQAELRPDLESYTEQSRQPIRGDGSWRITGLRTTPTGNTEQINTFIESNGALLGIMDVIISADAAQNAQVQTIMNTFSLAAAADLPVSDLTALTSSATQPIEIVNLTSWTSDNGVFFITGEVANHTPDVVTEVPIRAALLNDEGATITEAIDRVMGYAIESGGFAPFSLRFGQGQTSETTRYTTVLGSPDWQNNPTLEIISAPTLTWEDATQYTADNDLFIIGTLTNTGEVAVRQPRAVATIFDEEGRVIAAAFADLDVQTLDAGATTDFTILVSDLGGTAANYLVNVQALPCEGATC